MNPKPEPGPLGKAGAVFVACCVVMVVASACVALSVWILRAVNIL